MKKVRDISAGKIVFNETNEDFLKAAEALKTDKICRINFNK